MMKLLWEGYIFLVKINYPPPPPTPPPPQKKLKNAVTEKLDLQNVLNKKSETVGFLLAVNCTLITL